MAIDNHTHIYNEQIYKDYFKKAKGRVSKAFVMADWKEDWKGLIDFCSGKEDLFLLGTIRIGDSMESQLDNLEKLLEEKKIIGIKLYPGYFHFYPSDQRVFPVAELCQKYGKPLVFHSGDVFDPENKAVLKYSHPLYVGELAVRYPGCKMVISHFGFPYFLAAANVVDKNSNVFTDISGTIDELGSKKANKEIIKQYAADLKRAFAYFPDVKEKTMFGTDYCGEHTPLNKVNEYFEVAKKVFSKKERESVFHELAEKIYLS